jgi:hypothetical protein
MNVTYLELKNFRTITNFSADFEGAVYLITGENEVGKTTLLTAVTAMLTGEKPENLLQEGKQKGHAKMTIQDGAGSGYDIELSFDKLNPKGRLTITQQDTGMIDNRKTMLQHLLQYTDFDAEDFLKWSKTAEGRRKQMTFIKSLLPEDTQKQIASIEASIAELREERKTANTEHTIAHRSLSRMTWNDQFLKDHTEKKSIKKIAEEKSKVQADRQQWENAQKEYSSISDALQDFDKAAADKLSLMEDRLRDLQKQVEQQLATMEDFRNQAKKDKKELMSRKKAADKWFNERQEPSVDLTEFDEKIQSAEEHNEAVQTADEIRVLISQREEAKAQLDKIDEQVELYQVEKLDLLSGELPVPGLSFTEDGLMFEGRPFAPEYLSTSQEMEIAALLIMASNPKTKIFRIQQGESLGADRLKAIVDFAIKNGYQGFIEQVNRGQNELRVEKVTEEANATQDV